MRRQRSTYEATGKMLPGGLEVTLEAITRPSRRFFGEE
jgi:hypothetical protein